MRHCPPVVRHVCRLICCAAMVAWTGCSGPDKSSQQNAVLIRTDQQTVTQAQFERAFEAARIAYSDDRSVTPQTIENARLRLLNQMTEEVIVDRRAHELGIVLDDTEVEAAIQAIKKITRKTNSNRCCWKAPSPIRCGRTGCGCACLWKKWWTGNWFNR